MPLTSTDIANVYTRTTNKFLVNKPTGELRIIWTVGTDKSGPE